VIVPRKTYYLVAVALFVLLAATIAISFLDLGEFNTIAAISIAILKAALVVLYFMHVRYSSRLTWVFAVGGFFWLIVLFGLTMSDYLTR
jgi:cytochrome c oxidase subunit 4